MRMYDIIEKKKIGQELTTEEIYFFVAGYTKGDIPDYQASALLMAIYYMGMNERERYDLTASMLYSGDTVDLSQIDGIKVDKHSTGGVGDKVTLVLAPIVASLGVPVAKMSGRGLGHTGGTIDKLESFPGFDVAISADKFIDLVNKNKIAVTGQSKNLAPADKKLYALRDTTATVNEISLIASSVMSKKLASGSDAIVLDVTCGSGAFMETKEDARKLAEAMVDIGKRNDKKMAAVITNMDEPLGYAIGNILEVKEAIDALKGNGPKDLMEVVYALGSYMVLFAEKASSLEEARSLMEHAVSSNAAFDKFKEFIASQGGDNSFCDNPDAFPCASIIEPIVSSSDGYINSINAKMIGMASMMLGGGRENLDDVIDMSVGVILSKKVGDKINAGDVIAYIHANDKHKLKEVKEYFLDAITISENPTKPLSMVLSVVE